MTRKDFVALARALAHVRPSRLDEALYGLWSETVTAVADACALSNARFDRSKFYDATEA